MLSCIRNLRVNFHLYMHAFLEHLPLSKHNSFFAGAFRVPYFATPWHYHPEYELVLIVESYGQRFVGNTVDQFRAGDLSFIGANVPHVYTNDIAFYEGTANSEARSIVVHFSEASFGEGFLSLPQMEPLRNLLHRSKRGMDITGETRKMLTKRCMN